MAKHRPRLKGLIYSIHAVASLAAVAIVLVSIGITVANRGQTWRPLVFAGIMVCLNLVSMVSASGGKHRLSVENAES